MCMTIYLMPGLHISKLKALCLIVFLFPDVYDNLSNAGFTHKQIEGAMSNSIFISRCV